MISTIGEKQKRSTASLNEHIDIELKNIQVEKAIKLMKAQYKPLIDKACRGEKTRLYADRRESIKAIKG